MLHIRLRRVGKAKQPNYRLVISEKSKDPWGDNLEILGTYNPLMKPSAVNFKMDRIKEWIGKGAQCSDTVWNILIDQGVVKGDKRKTMDLSTKRKAKMEKEKSAKALKDEAKKAADLAKKEAEEAAKKAEAEAKKEAEEAEKAAAKAAAEAPVEVAPEAPVELASAEVATNEAPVVEAPATEPVSAEEEAPTA
jgi:small subunit ribosomal protein S16